MKKQEIKEKSLSAHVARKRERTRVEILDAAQQILLHGGVDAVTLASVSGRLGVTKQALYHYFPSKEALVRGLVTTLLDDEVNAIVAALDESDNESDTLGTLIRAFYNHYIGRLDAFRTVYCQSQMYATHSAIDEDVVREEINPRTRKLFDALENRLVGDQHDALDRARLRRLAFTAWLSAVGLLTMLGVAHAVDDPLIHTDDELLDTLEKVFENASGD